MGSESVMYPSVRVSGGPRERGLQYGAQARERMRASCAAYKEIFAHYAGWDWTTVTVYAKRFIHAIEAFRPRYLEELHGMAEGSGLDFTDILALNVRTEIMYAALARKASTSSRMPPPECTAFAALTCAPGDSVVVGQNWDWRPHGFDTVVVLQAQPSQGPAYVTVVEAGLLAKSGMNAEGIGLVTNSIITDLDAGEPGVPYHVVLRALLDASTVRDALAIINGAARASSANYLIASADGVALDVEAVAGSFDRVRVILPEGDLLVHTNHLLETQGGVQDLASWAMPDSFVRLQRVSTILKGGVLSLDTVREMMRDHAGWPWSICAHADGRLHRLDQVATIASVLMDLRARRMWLADGQPCTARYREIDFRRLLCGGLESTLEVQ